MRTSANLRLSATYFCFECKAEGVVSYSVASGSDQPFVGLPFGWHSVNGCAICPEHQVVARIVPAGEKLKKGEFAL